MVPCGFVAVTRPEAQTRNMDDDPDTGGESQNMYAVPWQTVSRFAYSRGCSGSRIPRDALCGYLRVRFSFWHSHPLFGVKVSENGAYGAPGVCEGYAHTEEREKA